MGGRLFFKIFFIYNNNSSIINMLLTQWEISSLALRRICHIPVRRTRSNTDLDAICQFVVHGQIQIQTPYTSSSYTLKHRSTRHIPVRRTRSNPDLDAIYQFVVSGQIQIQTQNPSSSFAVKYISRRYILVRRTRSNTDLDAIYQFVVHGQIQI